VFLLFSQSTDLGYKKRILISLNRLGKIRFVKHCQSGEQDSYAPLTADAKGIGQLRVQGKQLPHIGIQLIVMDDYLTSVKRNESNDIHYNRILEELPGDLIGCSFCPNPRVEFIRFNMDLQQGVILAWEAESLPGEYSVDFGPRYLHNLPMGFHPKWFGISAPGFTSERPKPLKRIKAGYLRGSETRFTYGSTMDCFEFSSKLSADSTVFLCI
jgi:hypothetical protein